MRRRYLERIQSVPVIGSIVHQTHPPDWQTTNTAQVRARQSRRFQHGQPLPPVYPSVHVVLPTRYYQIQTLTRVNLLRAMFARYFTDHINTKQK